MFNKFIQMKTLHILIFALFFNSFALRSQELAMLKESNLIGYINKSGDYVIEPQFNKASDFSGKYAAAEKDGKWGVINTEGNWVVQPEFDRVKDFNSGYALALKDNQWNYIDPSGKVLDAPVPDKFFDFKHLTLRFDLSNLE